MSSDGDKPFYVEYHAGWWRQMLATTIPRDVPAEFDTLNEARDFAAKNASGRPYAMRVLRRSTGEVVAHYAAGGRRII